MNRPPEPPPEGVLIESARTGARLSVREAARRAGISEGWWRQVVKGYQSLSGGAYGAVRGVPADTVARMARATGRVTPERMETEGQRPDAAEAMRQEQERRAAAVPDLESDDDGSDLLVSPAMRAAAAPHIRDIRQLITQAILGGADTPVPQGSQVFSPEAVLRGDAGPREAERWDALAAVTPEDPDRPGWRLARVVTLQAIGRVQDADRRAASQGRAAG